jgi:cystathionine beta-lyase
MDFDALDVEQLRRRSGEKWTTYPADVLPAWVADMDFPVAEPLQRLFAQMLENSDFGYPVNPTPSGLPSVFAQRMRALYGWQVEPERVLVLTDVVQGLYVALETCSEPGDAVITPVPIYPPFLNAVGTLQRTPLWLRFALHGGRYAMDIEALRRELSPRTRVLLLCNPHNPSGRVLERAELEALGELVLERDLVVISDEIHAELILGPQRHIPFAALGPELAARTITLASPSKAFNIAGTRCAVAAFGSAELQQRFGRIPRHVRGGINSVGLAAARVAWLECDAWLERVRALLAAQRDFLALHAQRHWPRIGHVPPEATYLAWLDCRALDLQPSPYRFFLERARVALSDGAGFGEEGRGFVRLNFATSRPILSQILERMDKALEDRARG